MTIAVAHCLSTLRNASRILVLDDGRVAGLGTHAELLDACAVYRRLWDAQAVSLPAAYVPPLHAESPSLDQSDNAPRVAGS